jgi:hypothetical protein
MVENDQLYTLFFFFLFGLLSAFCLKKEMGPEELTDEIGAKKHPKWQCNSYSQKCSSDSLVFKNHMDIKFYYLICLVP